MDEILSFCHDNFHTSFDIMGKVGASDMLICAHVTATKQGSLYWMKHAHAYLPGCPAATAHMWHVCGNGIGI